MEKFRKNKPNKVAKYISGKNSVIDAVANKFPIKNIYLTNAKNIVFFPNNIQDKIHLISIEEMNELTKTNHQGFIAEIDSIQYQDINFLIKNKKQIVLILDHLQDTHNFGAIIRTANAFGVNDIIFPKENAVQINDTVLKVSSGGFVGMNFYKTNSLVSTIQKLKNNGFWIYTTKIDDQSVEINEANFNFPLAIVVGSEQKGVSKSVMNTSDQNVYISMKGNVQSLNVSVATAIILNVIAKSLN